MKLVLSSSGFETPELVQAFAELCGKPKEDISFAVINEAYAVEVGDKRWVLDDLHGIVNNFGGSLDLINLLALSLDEVRGRIEKCDAIFAVGGHTDYLMHVYYSTGFAKILPELLESKVYMGSSAGSMVLGRRVSTEAYARVYGERNDYDVREYLGLVDFALKPHLNSKNFPNNRPEVLDEVSKGLSFDLYGIQDDTAIFVDGERQYIVGSEPYIVKMV